MKKKKEKILLIIWTISLVITISGLTVTFLKFENNKKKYNEELINNDLCSRKTFSGQLEYIANEQAVYYNLDSNNIYKDIIDTSQNKFKEYMEAKGWEYDAGLSRDFASEIVEFELMKNNVVIFFTAIKDWRFEPYYKFYWLSVGNKEKLAYKYDDNYRERLNISAVNPEKIQMSYDDDEKELEKFVEKTFKEFIKDVQDYAEETCSASEDGLGL